MDDSPKKLEVVIDSEEHCALLALARWVRENTEKRTRPAAKLVALLNRVADAQGQPRMWADFKDGKKIHGGLK